MRIGIDARFYGSVGKGLGRYTEKLIKELERLDTQNDYTIFLCAENFAEYQPANPRFRKVLVRSRWYSLSEQVCLPWLLYRQRLDLMHFPHFNVPLLYRRPFVFTLHDLILFHFPTPKASTHQHFFYRFEFLAYRVVLASALRRSALVITVSDFTAQDMRTHYPRASAKIRVTKEAAEQWCAWSDRAAEKALLDRLALLRPMGENGIIPQYVLYVGNAYPHKNLGILLEAAKTLPEKRFVFVGREDFFYRRLKGQAQDLGLTNVIFADYLTDQELGVLYRRAEMYIFPSLYEGFGLPPLEAMQYGTPVLAANRSSLPEVLGEAALYFDPEQVNELTAGIRKLSQEPHVRVHLQGAGYVRAGSLSWEKMAEDTLNLYEEALHKQKTLHGYQSQEKSRIG